MTLLRSWVDFALQQMAAESYIDRFLSGELALDRVLKMGNNNLPGDQSGTDVLSGKTRMTTLQAQAFTQRYQILDHHANDATGFSATLMKDLNDPTGQTYTLSFRSTESAPVADGGDQERDLFGANVEIGASGFAFGQLAAMEEYFARLKQGIKSDGTVDATLQAFFATPGHTIDVTGFSLGGHLATVFTELHNNEVNQTYLFNAAGRGHVPGAVPGLAAEENRISDMLAYFRSVLDDPDVADATFSRDNPIYDAASASHAADPGWDPFDQGAATLYSDARYEWAKAATQALFNPSGLTFLQSPGEVQDQGPFAKITQLYGQATTDDVQFVANAGVHAPAIPIFIEGQPLIAGDPFPSFTESGNTHSITLIVDSLATQELIQSIDLVYGQASAELLIKASSNTKADTIAPLNTPDVAEGDSLEKTVDAFRKLFLGPNLPAPNPLPVDSSVGGFGNLANRNDMYTAMAAIQQAVQAMQAQGVVFTIDDLTNPTVSSPAIAGIADTETDQGLAYRYALKELNPFAVVANTSQANDALYQPHNDQGQLIRVNPINGTGALTTQYLDDRALFLKEKITLNQLDHATSTGNIHFKDFTPNGLEIATTPSLRADREFLFGSDDIDTLTGGSKDDHLFGGGSADVLIGNAGRDYLEGNGGSDRLEGGTGADTMVGGSGNDTYLVDDPGDQVIEVGDNGTDSVESSVNFSLFGTTVETLTLTGTDDLNGTGNDLNNDITGNSGVNRLEGQGGTDHLIGNGGNDVLAGGTGDNDLLEGGAGFDTYIYNAGDGTDRIEDSDASGQIIFNGHRLRGGIHDPNDPSNTYKSLDGLTTYVLSGTDLVVNGVLTVNENFQSGQFGIQLDDLSNYPTNTGIPTGPFSGVFIGTESDDGVLDGRLLGDGVHGDAVYGLGGNNYLVGLLVEPDLLDGGSGADFLIGYGGNDYLDGGGGDDHLYAGSGKDILLGGAGNDVLIADANVAGTDDRDYLDGGDGADSLWGGWGTDVLLGGDGDDTLRGDNLPAGWPDITVLTGEGDFIPFPGPAIFSSTGAADFLDGGSGNDLLVGDGGDDILSGGDGNDQLFGDDEAGYLVVPGDDRLDGGAGDDLLAGGDGADSLSGGTGIDQLFGDKGDDVLDGGDEADTLHGGDGADELFGGAGDDQLFGDGLNNLLSLSEAGGEDFLDGGEGNDHLEGGIGDDTLFGGSGNDVLFGDEGADSLFGDEGDDELQGGEGNDLLSGDAGDDQLFGQAGDDTLSGDEGNDQLAGNDGNDTLVGGNGNDVLEGGHGNDVLVGGAGHDLYNFSLGDGQDTITDTARAGEGNLIQFFGGITLGSLSFIQDQAQQTLTIQVAGGDSIRLLGFDPNRFSYVVDTLSFADGTQVALADQVPLPGGLIEGTDDNNVIRTGSGDDTIFAEAGNDVVFAGAGNDVLVGGVGADMLQGGAGQDTYVFNSGDGMDIVSDQAGEGNRLLFGPGISAGAVTLGLGAGELLSVSVRTGMAGDAIQIISDLAGGESPSVDTLEFADGTTLSVKELLARGIEITGTAGPDTLAGTNLIDRISGGVGNDFIYGGLGADILRGEDGNDQLFGGDGDDLLDGGGDADVLWGEAGQDTYVFGRGSGQDILRDFPVAQSGPNTIQLTSDVLPADVRLQARQSDNGIDVVLTINGTQDELTLLGADDPSLLPISRISFADGTSWETAEILARIEGVSLTAVAAGSFLEGTAFRDELIGARGNDDLDGLGGADRMVGGAGDDHYWVDDVGDMIVEAVGGGTDTVLSQIDYTLPDYVENLFLRTTNFPTTDPVRGEGNASDNLLIGNFVSNVLVGGAGNDIFWGGFSIGGDYGPGDDDLSGGAGNDTYVVEGEFNGFDLIHDVALPGEGNRLQFGNSVRPEDVVFVQEDANLGVTNSGGIDGAVLVDFDPSGIVGSLVTEVVAFSGGYEDVTGGYETSLLALMNPTVGTDNIDTLTGSSNGEVVKAQGGDDVIVGGMGNDVLLGGTGDDTYLFNLGDGFDLIDDQPGAGDSNTVQFGAGITQDMLRISYNGTFGIGGLSVLIGTSGDGLHFLGVSADDPNAPHAIDTFHFADGTQLTFAELFEREIVVQGTGRSDGELFGTVADDLMLGLSGSETLASQDGNDTLVGGPGNDVLDGGRGSDTYVFNLGDGFDEIRDDYSAFDINRLRFGPGIAASDLALFDAGDGFTVNRIVIGTSGDEILLPNFIDAPPALTIAEFADGVTLNLKSLHAANQRTDDQTITGGAGDTVLIGGRGNDTIIAGDGTATLLGGAGDDTLIGGSGPNMFVGGPGNDFLIGGSGGNTFFLMVGNGLDSIQIPNYLTSIETNTVQFGGAYDTYHPTSGVGSLVIRYGTAGDELHILDFDPTDVFAPPAIQTFRFTDRTLTYEELITLGFDIDGTSGNDVLTGTNTTDRLLGLAGNDDLSGGAGADTFTGGQGDDTLHGGAGDDTYVFNIGDGIDRIQDAVTAGEGNRIQFGVGIGQSNLAFTQDQTARTLTIQVGSSGMDKLLLTDFDPTGANGSLVVETLAFADGSTVSLAALLDGPLNHAPTVANALADQTVSEDAPFTVVVPVNTFADEDAGDTLMLSVSLADGSILPAWLQFTPLTRTFSGTPGPGDAGSLQIAVTATDTGNLSASDQFALVISGPLPQTLVGTTGNDVLIGGRGDDTLRGLAGNDTLQGVAGNDLLDGGAGIDTLIGGTGNDTYVVDAAGDVVTELANEGTDTVQSSITYTLGTNVENLTLTGTAAINGTGNALNNNLIGNSANNTLNGGAGNDRLDGGLGNDTMIGGTGDDIYAVNQAGDVVTESANQGNDTVESSITFNLALNVENLALTGTANINGTGSSANNVLIGNSGNNTLDGGSGNDSVDGGDGNDSLLGGSGNDVLLGGLGNDILNAGSGNDLLNGGDGTDILDGDSGDDQLFGGAGSDMLTGGSGADQFTGGTGNDTMNGGSGNDIFFFGRGDGQDLIQDNSGSGDKISFDSGINSLNLVISRQTNDLRLAIHGSSDQVTIQNWYTSSSNRIETIQAGNGQTLLSTQIDQLIQAMAGFTQQTGLTWDQAIDQQPQNVQAVLAASWQ